MSKVELNENGNLMWIKREKVQLKIELISHSIYIQHMAYRSLIVFDFFNIKAPK